MRRKSTRPAVWLCAVLALGVAFWLRPDGEKKAGLAAEGSGPRVTKAHSRESDAGERRTKNPREEFEAARKRGLTEEEVRWIVEDFMELGIDSDGISAGTQEGYYQLRMKRQAWLIDALVSGFGLSDEQKKQAAARLRDIGEKDYKEFEDYLAEIKTIEVEGKAIRIIDGSKVWKLTDAEHWLTDDQCLPWNLCELDEAQKEMIGLRIEGEEWIWPRPGSETVDFGTKETYENLDDPFTNQSSFITEAGKIFPLSMEQVDRIRGGNSLSSEKFGITVTGRRGLLLYVRGLSTPQLMTLLLLRPDMAVHLRRELGE